jgi:ubiquinone biosynthesis protein
MSWKEKLPPELIPTPIPVVGGKKPVEIQEYRRRFSSRKLEFVVKFGSWIAGNLWRKIRGKGDERESAVRLRLLFESMGALWIKLGQLISLRSDVLSPAMCDELSKLQFRSVGFPWFQAKSILEVELGKPVESVFTSIDEMPMAAASISQVHLACLPGDLGQVAVKVQRPYVEEDLGRDLHILELIIGTFKRLHILTYLRWDSLLWELRQILLEEVDYRYEASNQRRMRKMLRAQKIYAPRLVDHLCTKRVLVMEYVPGGLMSDYLELYRTDPSLLAEWRQQNNIDPERVGVQLFLSFFRQLMEENFFHADLHPGNILLLRNSRFCLIDFGSAGTIEANLLRIYTMSLNALGEKDFRRAVDYTLLMCEDLPSQGLEEAKTEMVRAYRQWSAKSELQGVDYHEKSIAAAGTASGQVMGKYKIAASWQFLKISRTWVTLDSSLAYLLDESNFVKLIHSYFRNRQKRERKLREKRGAFGNVAGGLSEILLLESANLRRQMQRLGEATGKAASVAAIGLTGIRHILLLLMVLVAALLVFSLLGYLPVPAVAIVLLLDVQRRWALSAGDWLFLLVITGFLWLRTGRIIRGLLTKEMA